MKSRNGFVSNSSSSSFVIVGIAKYINETQETFKELFNFFNEDLTEEHIKLIKDHDTYDLLDDLCNIIKKKTDFDSMYDFEYGHLYIGKFLSPPSEEYYIKNNEVGIEDMNLLMSKLSDIGLIGEVKVYTRTV